MNARQAALGLGVALVGCGTKETIALVDAAVEDSAPDDGATIVDAASDGCPALCPATPPDGGACTAGTVCTYGNDPRVACRINVACYSNHWVVDPAPSFCNDPPSASVCPTTFSDLLRAFELGGRVHPRRELLRRAIPVRWGILRMRTLDRCDPHLPLINPWRRLA